MLQENSTKLSFSIEESVWLNKGQEIAEVLSMSLDPSISIEERSDHVQIKGGLQLVGEYRSHQEESVASQGTDDESITFRSIEEVSVTDGELNEVRHFFPIDVTIPLNRINNLNDIYVQVESFDYDLPDRNCIQLTADVTISGMSSMEQQDQRDYEENIEQSDSQVYSQDTFESVQQFVPPTIEQQYHPPFEETYRGVTETQVENTDQSEDTSFHFEATKIEEDQVEPNAKAREHEMLSQVEVEESDSTGEVHVSDTSVQEENAAMEEGLVRNEEPVSEEVEISVPQEKEAPQKQETVVNIAPLKKIAEKKQPPRDEIEQESPSEEEAPKKQKVKQRKNENALYLTKMLSNGEEKFSKLKMCIIQDNESLDMIAERYKLTTSQIVRVNRLESERLEEGQILYIPVGKK